MIFIKATTHSPTDTTVTDPSGYPDPSTPDPRHQTCLPVDGHGPLEDAMHAQDGGLGGVDDGRPEHGAEHAPVADGEGAPVHVLHGQLVTARLGTVTALANHLLYMNLIYTTINTFQEGGRRKNYSDQKYIFCSI